jgi:DNA-3-methyladenine glycosylase II
LPSKRGQITTAPFFFAFPFISNFDVFYSEISFPFYRTLNNGLWAGRISPATAKDRGIDMVFVSFRHFRIQEFLHSRIIFAVMERIRDKQHFETLCNWCIQIEPNLKTVIDKFGYPPFWHREPDFDTLVLTILEQQVSLASAKAAFVKLKEKIGDITPENIMKLTDDELRSCYFSKQKILYVKILAAEIVTGKLDLKDLSRMEEKEIRHRLVQIKGIGHWTIDMYLLMSLHLADIFPPGDLATIKAIYELDLVSSTASKEEIIIFMKRFSPFQSAVTYILWHSYIERRKLTLE